MQAPSEREPVRWVAWQDKQQRGPSMPSTPGSPFVQSVFSTPASPAKSPITDPHDIDRNAIIFSKEFMRKYFLIWYWASYTLFRGIGFDFGVSLFVALICMIIGCVTFGIVRALDESQKAKGLGTPGSGWLPPALSTPATISAPPPPQHFSISLTPQVNPPTPPPSAVTPTISDPFVGNIVLGIYHLENCDWVNQISAKNRVGFSTASEAVSHGFKPCRICSPAT